MRPGIHELPANHDLTAKTFNASSNVPIFSA